MPTMIDAAISSAATLPATKRALLAKKAAMLFVVVAKNTVISVKNAVNIGGLLSSLFNSLVKRYLTASLYTLVVAIRASNTLFHPRLDTWVESVQCRL